MLVGSVWGLVILCILFFFCASHSGAIVGAGAAHVCGEGLQALCQCFMGGCCAAFCRH